MRVPKEDFQLSADQLDDKYNPDGDGEHPVLTRAEWQAAVADGNTISGYWKWIEAELVANPEFYA